MLQPSAIWISRRKQFGPSAAAAISGLRTLMATERWFLRSSARYTVAMPPRPNLRRILLPAESVNDPPQGPLSPHFYVPRLDINHRSRELDVAEKVDVFLGPTDQL